MTMNSNPFKESTYVVFGAAGGWGFQIYKKLCEYKAEVDIIEIGASSRDRLNAIRKNKVVILAIPDDAIDAELVEAGTILAEQGKSIIDCATNKAGFSKTLRKLAVSGASVCSTHPMIMPGTSPRGQTCILMPVGTKPDHATGIAREIFERMGMNIEPFDFSQHADAMVILQMVPHLVQRILIDALGHGLEELQVTLGDDSKVMTLEDIGRLATANYLLCELGIGRVAIQRPDVSAGIIASSIHNSRFGSKVLGYMLRTLGNIVSAGENRDELSKLFQESIVRLDPEANWRTSMETKSEVALTRLGNLRKRSFQVKAPDAPGILNRILTVLYELSINMTALDSQLVQDQSGKTVALFDIGITDEGFDQEALVSKLNNIGVEFMMHG